MEGQSLIFSMNGQAFECNGLAGTLVPTMSEGFKNATRTATSSPAVARLR
jgi:hypothetical protein